MSIPDIDLTYGDIFIIYNTPKNVAAVRLLCSYFSLGVWYA